jgi:hypothetical protein
MLYGYCFSALLKSMPFGRARKLKLNGALQLLAYADDVNLLEDNIVT